MSYGIPVVIDPTDFKEKCARHAKNLAFITLIEASAITKEYGHGYSLLTLRKERHLGSLRAMKMGNHVYLDWSMLLDFLQRKAT